MYASYFVLVTEYVNVSAKLYVWV